MSRSTVFQFRTRDSIFHRADPLTKFAWMLTVSLLAFGAYIAWIQIAITVMVKPSGPCQRLNASGSE